MDIRMPRARRHRGDPAAARRDADRRPRAHPHDVRPRRVRLRGAARRRQRVPAQGRAAGGAASTPSARSRAGEALLAPAVTRRLIEEFARRSPGARPRPTALAELTDRELEVLRLIARGLSNAEIAAQLVVSEATVKTHVGRILTKLGLRDRVQAVVLAYESGLVRPGAT